MLEYERFYNLTILKNNVIYLYEYAGVLSGKTMKFGSMFNFSVNKKYALIAFSLIEIMLSLVIVSCILGAFAPIVSKKMNSTAISVGATAAFSKNCSDKYGASCILCTSKACMSCTLDRKAPEGQYLDVDMCEYKACSDLFTANCLNCAHDRCTLCKTGTYINTSNGKCVGCASGKVCDGIYQCGGTCKTCSGSGANCKSCASGFYLKSASGTVTCDNCANKVSHCTSCTEAGVCTGCASGYFLSNSACQDTL